MFTLVLPALIAGFLLWDALDQVEGEAAEEAEKALQAYSAELRQALTPEFVLSRLLHHLSRLPASRLEPSIRSLERSFPGAFRWLVWNRNGTVRTMRGPMVSGIRTWESFIRAFLSSPSPPAITSSTPEIKRLQTLLGRDFPFADLVTQPGSVLETEIFERPTLVIRMAPARAPRPGAPGGILLFVDLYAIPDAFWLRFGTAFHRQTYRGPKVRQLLLPLDATEAKDQSPPTSTAGLPRAKISISTIAGLLTALQENRSGCFRWKHWIGCEVYPPLKRVLFQRILILRSFSDQYRYFTRLRATLILFTVLLPLLAILFLRNHFVRVHVLRYFPRKIGLLFAMSLLLPLTIAFALAGHIRDLQIRDLSLQAQEHLSTALEKIMARFRGFPSDYDQLFLKMLDRAIKQDPTERHLRALLLQLTKDRHISGFTLTDYSGRIEWIHLPTRQEDTRPFLQTFLPSFFSERKAENALRPVAQHLEVDLRTGFRFLKFGRTATYFMGISLLDPSGHRLLLIEIERQLMEELFLRYDHRQRRRLSSPTDTFQAGMVTWQGPRINPENSFSRAFRTAGLWRDFSLRQPISGVLDRDSQHLMYFTSAQTLDHFRPVVFVSLLPELQNIHHRHSRTIWAVLLSLMSASLIGLLLGDLLISPLRALHNAIQGFREQQITPALDESGTNEISILSRSFNRMVTGLQERASMRRFLSSSTLLAIHDQPGFAAKPGRRQSCVVWFAHIHSFAELLRTLPSDEIFLLLNDILAGIERCLRSCGGEVDKFFDDGIMAVFPGEFQELPAVHASWAVADFIRRLNEERCTRNLPSIRLGMGINAGEVILGCVGSRQRQEFTVIGDAVNVAARLEAVSEEGRHSRIMISETVFTAVQEAYECRKTDITRLKGKADVMSVFEVVSRR